MRLYEIADDLDYYMTEGCGIFAYALSRIIPGGKIIVICNTDYGSEKWSDEIPFEVTHVAYAKNEATIIDVKGVRSISEMVKDFRLETYDLLWFTPNRFRKEIMGSGDEFPLYGEEEDFREAEKIIKSNPSFYGIN